MAKHRFLSYHEEKTYNFGPNGVVTETKQGSDDQEERPILQAANDMRE